MFRGLKGFMNPTPETRKENANYLKAALGCTDEEKYALYDLLMFLLSLHGHEVLEAKRQDYLFAQNYNLISGVYDRLAKELISDPPEEEDDDE